MIYVLIGDNSYAIRNRLKEIILKLDSPINQPSVENLDLSDISVMLLGKNLFSENQTLVLNNLSERKDIFESAINLIINSKDTVDVILLENALDKRTSIYKKISANASVEDFKNYTDRDTDLLIKWLRDYAKGQGVEAEPSVYLNLVNWVGPNQEQLASAVDRLIIMDALTKEGIELYIPKTPSSFSFDLFSTTIKKDSKKLSSILQDLKQTQDPYMLMGLLISQVIQVLALSNSGHGDNVAKDLGASPYALNNLRREINLTPEKAKMALGIFYDADSSMKSTSVDPWQAIEIALNRLIVL